MAVCVWRNIPIQMTVKELKCVLEVCDTAKDKSYSIRFFGDLSILNSLGQYSAPSYADGCLAS